MPCLVLINNLLLFLLIQFLLILFYYVAFFNIALTILIFLKIFIILLITCFININFISKARLFFIIFNYREYMHDLFLSPQIQFELIIFYTNICSKFSKILFLLSKAVSRIFALRKLLSKR